jgi:hypothetical protein
MRPDQFNIRELESRIQQIEMAKTLVGTSVPANALKPNKLKVKLMNPWLEKVGIFEPDAPTWSNLGYIIFVGLLYDNFSDFFSGIFPPHRQMKDDYDFSN